MKISKKRILFIDIAKAIAIFTVLAGHTVDSDTVYKTIIYSFHMPLFFLLSGFTGTIRDQYDLTTWTAFFSKKLRTLLFPYFLWACIYSSFSFKHLLQILWGTRETLIGAGSLTSLWFLPVLFVASVLTECTNAAARKWNHRFIPIMAAVLFIGSGLFIPHAAQHGYPWGADIALTAAGFMLIGQMLRQLYSMSVFHKALPHILCCCITLGSMLAVFLILKPEGYVLMANAVYGNRILFLFTSLMGSLFVLSSSKLLENIGCYLKVVIYLGQNTLGVFILHKPVVELIRSLVTRLGYEYNNLLNVVLIPMATICVVIPVMYMIQKYVPFMFGDWKTERSEKR